MGQVIGAVSGWRGEARLGAHSGPDQGEARETVTLGARFEVVPKSSVITKHNNRLMCYLKRKINVNIHDKQNISTLTKVSIEKRGDGGNREEKWEQYFLNSRGGRGYNGSPWDSVRATDPLSKLTGTRAPTSAYSFEVYGLAQVYLWILGESV